MASNRPPQGSRASQGNGGQSSGLDPLMVAVLVGGVVVLCIVLWQRFHTPLSWAYGAWRMLTNSVAWVFGEFVFNVPGLIKPFHDAAAYFWAVDPSQVTFDTIRNTSIPVNIGLLVFVILPIAVRSILVSLKTNPFNHKNFGKAKDFTLDSFMKAQEKIYPHLKLFGSLNLLKQGVNHGRLRMADNAKQFIMSHRLVHRESAVDKILIEREASAKVFKSQLGSYWTGVDALSPVELILFAAFAPKAAACDPATTDDAYEASLKLSADLIDCYWHVFSPEPDGSVPSPKAFVQKLVASTEFAKAKRVAVDYAKLPAVQKIIQGHAYVRTVLYALLVQARKTGVLPSAEFRWCKVIDRELWFTMNTVGRNVAVPEVAGVFAHYLYEVKAMQATDRPMVDTAVDALQEAFAKLTFTVDEWNAVRKSWTITESETSNKE